VTENTITMTLKPMELQNEESKLIQAAKEDPKAFGELYNRYIERVFKYLYSRLGNAQDAEDLTSMTFLSAYQSFGQYRQDGHFASWLFAIARNKVNDHYRRLKITVTIEEDHSTKSEADPLMTSIENEQAATLGVLIRELAEPEQDLLRLRFLVGMSFSEMARLLHRSENSVKKSTYRILARLHSQMEENND